MSNPAGNNKLVLEERAPNNQSAFPDVISQTSSPGIAAVHIILKLAIVFIYLIFPLATSSFNVMMIVIVAAAIDFWIVKNLAGRLLVGLRWWIDFDENGEQAWKFQCKVDERSVSPASDKAFWWTLALFSLVWILLTFINVLKLDVTQITICGFCGALLIFNLHSYYKCSKIQSQNVNKLISQYGMEAAAKFMQGSIVAGFK